MKVSIANKHVFPDEIETEIVERKGIGHPDSIADGIAEKISIEYSKYCIEQFGVALHHNVDKINALGGLAKTVWGSDELIEPIRIILNGRISGSFGGKKIPVNEICEDAAKSVLSRALPNLNIDKDVVFKHEHTTYSQNSRWFNPVDLNDLPETKVLLANDTSAVASSSTFTNAERLVLEIEGFFYDQNQRPRFRQFGQDIKVMIIRNGKHYDIRICVPVFLKYAHSSNDYFDHLNNLQDELKRFIPTKIQKEATFDFTISGNVNEHLKEAKYHYALVGGSALDYGEEGLVGRGNNRSGIIPMFRSFSMEAAYGKNPVYHVGKVLGVAIDELSSEIFMQTGIVNEILAVAKKGDPLLSPSQLLIRTSEEANDRKIKSIISEVLSRTDWTKRIIMDQSVLPSTGNIMLKKKENK